MLETRAGVPARSGACERAWPFRKTPRCLGQRQEFAALREPGRGRPRSFASYCSPKRFLPGQCQFNLCLHSTTHVAAGRRDGVAHLHAGRVGLGPTTGQLHDAARRIGEVGDPDVIVAVHSSCPRCH